MLGSDVDGSGADGARGKFHAVSLPAALPATCFSTSLGNHGGFRNHLNFQDKNLYVLHTLTTKLYTNALQLGVHLTNIHHDPHSSPPQILSEEDKTDVMNLAETPIAIIAGYKCKY